MKYQFDDSNLSPLVTQRIIYEYLKIQIHKHERDVSHEEINTKKILEFEQKQYTSKASLISRRSKGKPENC